MLPEERATPNSNHIPDGTIPGGGQIVVKGQFAFLSMGRKGQQSSTFPTRGSRGLSTRS
jgi:hypothetical protein